MSELEEKFVSDDGVSTVPSPVTPAGGEIKKKLADVKKAVHPKAEKVDAAKVPGQKVAESEEADDVEVIEEEIISVEESIAEMFAGMDLSEDFKSKVTLVFEAAVNEATKARVEEAVGALEEEFEQKLEESVTEAIEEIVENLDSYLDYVVKEWMEENEVAIESGIKVEMAESLMDGLRELFSEHNIEIDDETVDVVAGLEEQIEELSNQANQAINENIELAREVAALKAELVFEEISEGLTVSQKERLKTLSEKLDFSDVDAYETDLNTLKESFFKTKKVINENAESDDEFIAEETAPKKPASQYSSVAAIVEALNHKNAK
jgi:AcrR family transcriptional regulator